MIFSILNWKVVIEKCPERRGEIMGYSFFTLIPQRNAVKEACKDILHGSLREEKNLELLGTIPSALPWHVEHYVHNTL